MLIGAGRLNRDVLAGQVALVTGAGRGIGLEACRSLAWLGARVVMAEVDAQTGRRAEATLLNEFGLHSALFVHTDVSRESHIRRLRQTALRAFGQVDIVINNATITPMGAVQDVPAAAWDASYGVNLRAPVLLAQAFLPDMIARNRGVFICVSSVGQAFMGAYECFKAAQVHLGETLDAELEARGAAADGVFSFTIGPGLVRTPGAEAGIARLAPLYGKSVEEFYAMSAEHIISVEAAGAGFAAAAALAEQFRGQEISARQALISAGIRLEDLGPEGPADSPPIDVSPANLAAALEACRGARQTLLEQSKGWQARSLFERQWMLRDFRKHAGLPVENWLEELARLEAALAAGDASGARSLRAPLHQLAGYYRHMRQLAEGYEKNPEKLAEQVRVIESWREEAQRLAEKVQALAATGNDC